MDLLPVSDLAAPVCTTSEAARRLGVSSTTIQVMVERGELKAWRTRGGHRRISVDSVESVQRQRGAMGARFGSGGEDLAVLVVESATGGEGAVVSSIRGWGWPLQVLSAGNGLEALLLVERRRPDIALIDLDVSRFDGVELVRSLRAHHEFDAVQLVALTSRPLAAKAAGLPVGVAVFSKPLSIERLQGFIEAHVVWRSRIGTQSSQTEEGANTAAADEALSALVDELGPVHGAMSENAKQQGAPRYRELASVGLSP
jgi:excisionase family DNA binding protein